MNSNHLTNGFKPGNLVYNFYPVDENIVLIADDEFIYKTYTRLLTKPFNRSYYDGSVENSAGNIVDLDYTWENLNSGVQIHDYASAGGKCDEYLGCMKMKAKTRITNPTNCISKS